MPEIHHNSFAKIQINALPRDPATLAPAALDQAALDQAALDPAALAQLQSSIAAEGLRQPIEVWRLPPRRTASPTASYQVFFALPPTTTSPGTPEAWANISAFLRTPADNSTALAAMVSETKSTLPPPL